ncbi:MAG TPA: hypothetical protein VJN64_04960 [Terriglobales bacterium]|nr:hypothetical protein [Terriglobales bacterium]
MKLLANNTDWITLDQVKELTGWDERTIRRKQKAGALKSRATGELARNGRPIREYDANSLPAEAREKRLHQALATSSARGPASKSDSKTVLTLSSLSPEAQKQAKERLEIIQPMIEFANTGQEPLWSGPSEQAATLSGIVKHIATAFNIGERTIWNWWNAYKTGGPGALADKARSDRNISRFFDQRKEAAAFATNKFLNERLSITMTHEALVREWERLRMDDSDEPPAYKTTRLFLNGLPPIITAVARDGERAYKEDFAPYLLRDISKVHVNQYWISDHMEHDVFVRNIDLKTGGPVFGELALNAVFRPWLTAIVDMRSRRVVGQVWCVNPSSNTISSALRFGMRHYGLPHTFYIDNGKDYRKLGKRPPELSPDAQGVLVRLGVRSQHCLPRHPQSKQIESFFRTVHKRFDEMWGDAYCGGSVATRPEFCDELVRQHARLLKEGRGDESPLPSASEFIQAAADWMHVFNTTFRHRGQGMAGRTPQQMFDAELPPEKRSPVNPADVAQLFWDRQKRVVSEGGCVQLFNARYQPADADSAAALMLEIKREVLVACDPLNVGEAIALSQDGIFLGHLRAQELLVHGETSAEMIRASMRERRSIFKQLKRYTERLAQSRLASGDRTELEVLAQQAQAVGAPRAQIYALPAPKAMAAAAPRRMHADDIAELYMEGD